MKQMQKFMVGLLMVAVLLAPLGITGCGDGGATQRAKQEELVREAEHQQQLREEKLRQAQQETRKKQSEADNQDLENVSTAVGIGAGIVYVLYLICGGE